MDAALLSKIPLFAEFPEEQREDLVRRLRRRRYGRGEAVFIRGDEGTSLYVIEEGRVHIQLTAEDGREFVLNSLGPGDFFGDLALLDGEPRSADAIAVEPSRLALLERREFHRFLSAHPGAAVSLLAVLSRRLRRNAEIIQDAAFLDVPGRLARTLLDISESQGIVEDDNVVVLSSLTQARLASMIGATRESVNKWLGSFQRRGLIKYERGRLTILRPDDLRKRV